MTPIFYNLSHCYYPHAYLHILLGSFFVNFQQHISNFSIAGTVIAIDNHIDDQDVSL